MSTATATASGTPIMSTPAVIVENAMSTERQLTLIIGQIKSHEAIAFHQVLEIGDKLTKASELCLKEGINFETWAYEELQYKPGHAYRLMRGAKRINNHPDKRMLGVFEQASREAMWLLITAADSVWTEVADMVDEQGSPITKKQVDLIKSKYNVDKKVTKATLDIVDAVIENSLDQGIEFRALEAKIEKLSKTLAEESSKVDLLERSRNNLRLDLDAANADNEEQSKKIASLENKKSTAALTPKVDDRDVKKLADAKRELEQTERKLQETQASLAREQQRVASINQLVTATEVWLKELSPLAVGEAMVDMPSNARETLLSVIARSERQLAVLKKMLS